MWEPGWGHTTGRIVAELPNWVTVGRGYPIFACLPLTVCPLKFVNLDKCVLEGGRLLIKFSKDESPPIVLKFAEEKFPQFKQFLEAPSSPEIGTDVAQNAP